MSSTDPAAAGQPQGERHGSPYGEPAATSASPSPASPGPVVLAPNPLGVAALVAGIVLVAFGLVQQVVSVTVPSFAYGRGLDASSIGLIFSALNLVSGTIALVALVLGIIAITRPGARKGSAAAGLALGASGLLGSLFAFVVPLLAYGSL